MARLPRAATALDRACRLAVYIVGVTTPLGLAIAAHGGVSPSPYALGQCAALLALGVLAGQLVVASRWPWMERPFGLDRVLRFHRLMGAVAVGLLLAHPLLLAGGGGGLGLLTDLSAPWYIWVGKGTLVLGWAMVVAALCRLTLRIEFEAWRRMHAFVGPLLLLGALVHAFAVGAHLQTLAARAGLAGYAVVAVGFVLVARRACRRPYAVQAVREEAPNVWTVALAPASSRPAEPYLSGQFHFLTFAPGRGLPREEHPFTISSEPTCRDALASTIKASGDFTSRLSALRRGDPAFVSTPYGRFSYVLHPDETRLVFIAAGIGITPLMSMIRHMRASGADREVLLLYGNRNEEGTVFRRELAEIEAGGPPRLRIVHVLSRPDAGWEGETGRLDAERLGRLCGDVAGRGFYVCGPPGMMRETLRALRGLGVPRSRLHYEYFAL